MGMNSINQIVQEVARLPQDQRLTLANRILTLGEPQISGDITTAWDLEIRDRIDRYDLCYIRGMNSTNQIMQEVARLKL